MADGQYEKLEEIFSAALKQATTAERAAFLDEACGNDADLRARIEALLKAHEEAETFLVRPAEARLRR